MDNQMMETIQSTLDMLASQTDQRTSVFDVEVLSIEGSSLTLGGRLFDESQVETLSRHLPDVKLDTTAVRILRRAGSTRMRVATNLTGLFDKPTIHLPLSSELCYGAEVEVLEEEDKWAFIRQKDGYLGWVFKAHLADAFASPATHLVLVPACELRSQPDAGSEILTRVVSGMSVTVEETLGEWARVAANKTGWILSSHLRAISDIPETLEAKRNALIKDSASMIGIPYVWGGISGNGIDCSGLTRLLHNWIGIDIPRDADLQYAASKSVEPPFEVGDLLFFREPGKKRPVTHVGVSLGDWKMIHSSQANNGVYVDDVQERESLKQMFVSAGSFLR
jgi:gamma-D-glutamyl-L-lysine dipeptidyl-peptidase